MVNSLFSSNTFLGDNQLLIVRLAGLKPLHELIKSETSETRTAALACVRNLSMHPGNEVEKLQLTVMTTFRSYVHNPINHCQ